MAQHDLRPYVKITEYNENIVRERASLDAGTRTRSNLEVRKVYHYSTGTDAITWQLLPLPARLVK